MEQNASQGEKADIAADGIDEADHIFKTEDASHKSKGAQEGNKTPGDQRASAVKSFRIE